jgi:hypothetical protein
MNDDTLVVVCGYAGDAAQVVANWPMYEHHKCPIVILSPEDSQITGDMLPVRSTICRGVGKRAYIGPESLDRQRKHLRCLLDFPQKYFLINDSDSFCLSPTIPRYVYDAEKAWSNIVSDAIHIRKPTYWLPRLAFQPPYFFSRGVLERLVLGTEITPFDEQTPYIDHYMMSLTVHSKVPYQGFVDGASCGTNTPEGFRLMDELVRRHGRVFVHSIKTGEIMRHLYASHLDFCGKRP